MGLSLSPVPLPAQGSEVIEATAGVALLTSCWALTWGMHVIALVAVGLGGKGIGMDGGC